MMALPCWCCTCGRHIFMRPLREIVALKIVGNGYKAVCDKCDAADLY